jgi:hypothetical protein
MQALAVYNLTDEDVAGTEKAARSLGRILYSIFNASELLATKKSSLPLLGNVWLSDHDMQLMVARDIGGSSQALYVACWAGHNGQSHNHNDVGNFIIYANGRPFIIDVGKPEYTRQTFSSGRYELKTMQSAYHNLPTINGIMQKEGRQYAAEDVAYETAESFAQLKMNIAPAYPNEAGINSWLRTVRLNRGTDLHVVDSFDLKEKSRDIVQNLITPCEIVRDEPGQMVLGDPKEELEMVIRYDTRKLSLESETIDLNDERISNVWGEHLSRIMLKPKMAITKDTWTLRFHIVKTNIITQSR